MSHFDPSYFHGTAESESVDSEPTPLVVAAQPAGLENALRQQAQEPAEPVTAATVHPPEDLSKLGVPELRKRAAAAGIDHRGLRKPALLAKLSA